MESVQTLASTFYSHSLITDRSYKGKYPTVIAIRGKWLRSAVNIKEAHKQAKIYVRRSLTLHIFCFMLTDYA